MSDFPHLELRKRINGTHRPKHSGGSTTINLITQANLDNRKAHGKLLFAKVEELSLDWKNKISQRTANNLPEMPDSDVLPVFLKIDTDKCDVESLKSFGIEVIAEEEDGYIIGASSSDFLSLKEKIEKFARKEGKYKNKASQLWGIETGDQWRVEQILSDDLKGKWNTIQDADQIVVDVGIACNIKKSTQPKKKNIDTVEKYEEKILNWRKRNSKIDEEREARALARQTAFEGLVHAYGGEFLSSYVDYGDSYSCRISISGKGLKDIVTNYQFLFEVVEYDPLDIQEVEDGETEEINPVIIAPKNTAAKVCVIDSGIQENHRLLVDAIDIANSTSFVSGDTATADIALSGGHGTRVSGAILYPGQIPRTGSYTLPCYIQNARVLELSGGRAVLPISLYPPKLMQDIVNRFEGTRVFNMSINSSVSCKTTHMSQWAAEIDNLMFENDILFILSAGNLNQTEIQNHLLAARGYPEFLLEKGSRIANPAQSCFALTVGSICLDEFDDGVRESFGKKHYPSSFSRAGLGLWGMIKPDVVEIAGDFVKEKGIRPNISKEQSILPELVRSTIHGGGSVGRDALGTSFAAPRVSLIAATLAEIYPRESSNLYRALIVQSARLPEHAFTSPTLNDIQHYGYGVPDLKRATENSINRITFITTDKLSATQANTYSIAVPDAMRAPGGDYDVLIEVTLSFMAETRRTRRRTNSYLSSRLTWESSKTDESYDQFSRRVVKEIENSETETEGQNSIQWVIRETKGWSKINGLKRQDSTVQKSWCIMKSHNLPALLSLAVIGHKGWKQNMEEEIPYSLAVSFEALGESINVYEMIRIENEVEIQAEIEQEVII